MDFILSLCAIVVLAPVLLVVALLVRIKLGSPVIFKQQRPGLNDKIFTLYKFRTMTDLRNESGELLPDKERMTNFGKALRKLSVDELPELLNILKGDMSFVGPRPLLVRYLPFYRDDERERHTVRPGMTGLAQVSGRNFLNWDGRFAKDVEYVKNVSFSLDLHIILKTIQIVFKRSGVVEYDNAQQCILKNLDEERVNEFQNSI